MKTSTTLSEVLATITDGADEVDIIDEQAMAVVRKGPAQFVVRRNDDVTGAFVVAVHVHENAEDAAACHAWKVGLIRNPVGTMLSEIFGQAMFDPDQGGQGFYL